MIRLCLEVKVVRDCSEGTLNFSRSHYAKEVVESFERKQEKTVVTIMECKIYGAQTEVEKMDSNIYRRDIGSLMY